MPVIRSGTVVRKAKFIRKIMELPPEKWDECFVHEFRKVNTKVIRHEPDAVQDMMDVGDLVTAFRATEKYQQYRQAE